MIRRILSSIRRRLNRRYLSVKRSNEIISELPLRDAKGRFVGRGK